MNNRIKTKKFTSTVFALALGLGVAFGINYVSGNFTPPSQGFPNCPTTDSACNTPINVGASPQTKNGSLDVNAFTAWMNADFKQTVTFDSLQNYGSATSPATLCVSTNGTLEDCNSSSSGFPSTAAYTGIHNSTTGFVIPLRFNQTVDGVQLQGLQTMITTNPSDIGNEYSNVTANFISQAYGNVAQGKHATYTFQMYFKGQANGSPVTVTSTDTSTFGTYGQTAVSVSN